MNKIFLVERSMVSPTKCMLRKTIIEKKKNVRNRSFGKKSTDTGQGIFFIFIAIVNIHMYYNILNVDKRNTLYFFGK